MAYIVNKQDLVKYKALQESKAVEKQKNYEVKETLLYKENLIWNASDNFRFAAGVAGLGMILNNSREKGNVDFNMVIHLVQSSISYDPDRTKREFLNLVNKLKNL